MPCVAAADRRYGRGVHPVGVADLRNRLTPDGYAGAVLELTRVADDTALADVIARTDHPVVAVATWNVEYRRIGPDGWRVSKMY